MKQIKEHLPELVNLMNKLKSEEPDMFTEGDNEYF